MKTPSSTPADERSFAPVLSDFFDAPADAAREDDAPAYDFFGESHFTPHSRAAKTAH